MFDWSTFWMSLSYGSERYHTSARIHPTVSHIGSMKVQTMGICTEILKSEWKIVLFGIVSASFLVGACLASRSDSGLASCPIIIALITDIIVWSYIQRNTKSPYVYNMSLWNRRLVETIPVAITLFALVVVTMIMMFIDVDRGTLNISALGVAICFCSAMLEAIITRDTKRSRIGLPMQFALVYALSVVLIAVSYAVQPDLLATVGIILIMLVFMIIIFVQYRHIDEQLTYVIPKGRFDITGWDVIVTYEDEHLESLQAIYPDEKAISLDRFEESCGEPRRIRVVLTQNDYRYSKVSELVDSGCEAIALCYGCYSEHQVTNSSEFVRNILETWEFEDVVAYRLKGRTHDVVDALAERLGIPVESAECLGRSERHDLQLAFILNQFSKIDAELVRKRQWI